MTNGKTANFLYRLLCGFFLGISVIAPGVSGSVMAVMMGIYDELITIVARPFQNLKKNIFYLIPMGVGALLSVGIFIQLFRWLFDTYPIPANLLFIGLIAGSLPTVFHQANKGVLTKGMLAAGLAAFLLAVGTGVLAGSGISIGGVENPLYFALCGAVAGITGMIPGMSVSMMLILMGVYQPMLDATARFDVVTMLPVAVTFAAGLVLFSRLTKYIFEHFKSLGYSAVAGFMCGSLVSVFPGLPSAFSGWVLSGIMVICGLGISVLFQFLGKKFKTD